MQININPDKDFVAHMRKALKDNNRYRFGNCVATIKNSTKGSHYDQHEICRSCVDFPCHEGLYDLFCLSDGRICSCRWTERQKFENASDQIGYLITRFKQAEYICTDRYDNMRVREELNV